MFSALLSLLATGGALAATWLLVTRANQDRLLYLIAWSVTLVGISLALLAMTVGFALGFNGLLFRVAEIGAALLAPVWLGLGMVELIARIVQVRFSAWLFTISYSVVAIVIMLIDPLRKAPGDGLPKPGDTYGFLPLVLIDGAHVVAVIALVACAAFTAVLASRRDQEAAELLIPVALVALAGVLVVGGTRGLPGPLAAIALGVAAGLVWYGAIRTIPVYGDDEYDEEYGEGYYDNEPDPVEAAQRGFAPPEPKPAPAPAPVARGELRFPDPSPQPDPRYADPAGPTSVDPVSAIPPVPPGTDLAAARGQITVYTLLDGREEAFDRLAEDLVRGARAEPDTLVLTCHAVENAPTQRIVYRLFRDDASFTSHQRAPFVHRFITDSRTHVLATNVIDLKLASAKLPQTPALP